MLIWPPTMYCRIRLPVIRWCWAQFVPSEGLTATTTRAQLLTFAVGSLLAKE
jgi:hypothetical protein